MNHSEYDIDALQVSGIWRNGSVVRSWLLELLHAAFESHGSRLEDIAPYVEDSGEGRWTIHEAINESVPAPVIAASLFARFASRDEIKFSAKVAAALRNQFGGHAVKAVEHATAAYEGAKSGQGRREREGRPGSAVMRDASSRGRQSPVPVSDMVTKVSRMLHRSPGSLT